jgi:hypothetical protein
VWERALLPVRAVRRTARQQHHSSVFAKIVPRSGGVLMPRGITPRQPARTGRHEGARKAAPREKPGVLRMPRTGGSARPHTVGGTAPRKPVGKSYNPTATTRVQEILHRLNTLYPDVTCALHHHNAWELLVATILSAQSTDVRVNMVTPELFRKYPTVEDFAALTPEQLQPLFPKQIEIGCRSREKDRERFRRPGARSDG